MPFKFIHAADIHLDSPLIGLDRYESAPVDAMRGATRRAFEKLIDLAIKEEVAFVLLAGDLYDGDWKDFKTGLFFIEQMAKLKDVEIPAYIVAGNHDAASQITKNLRPPDNVHFFSTDHPETHILKTYDVAIHGQGYANRDTSTDISAAYPAMDPHLFNIGMLHTSLEGRPPHAPYAPTSPKLLAQKGYQYWALGHVHRREIVSQDPWIVFPGNLQGRHARETGPKGCTLVTVENQTVINVEFRTVDVMRWAVLRVDAEGATSPSDILDRVARGIESEIYGAEGRALAIRVEIFGTTSCCDTILSDLDQWIQEIRALAASSSSADVWIEKVRFDLRRPVDLLKLAARDDAVGDLIRDLTAGDPDPTELDYMIGQMADFRAALPPELLVGEDAVDLTSREILAKTIREANELLISRIAGLDSAS